MGVIQCGSFSGNTTVTLGWEPQWIMIKRTDSTGDWITIDNMRGCSVGGIDAVLFPNLSNAESVANDYIDFTTTGFISKNLTGTYIYTVIRRPMKVPTSGTEVYNAIARTGTGAAATVSGVGFAPDLSIIKARNATTSTVFHDKLRGKGIELIPSSTAAENSDVTTLTSFDMDGISLGTNVGVNGSSQPFINHFFKRAKGFMDIVCYTGTGVTRTVEHNLGVAPELIITKVRDGADYWRTLFTINSSGSMPLNTNGQIQDHPIETYYGNDTTYVAPTTTVFTVGSNYGVNSSGLKYVSYLFATLAGVSKIGSYTGNGSTQTIVCGFTTGARFVLSKAVSTTGNWNLGDSTRGITASTDPLLCLNTTAAEDTTDDWLDNDASGFIVNETSSAHANTNGVTYIFLAIA